MNDQAPLIELQNIKSTNKTSSIEIYSMKIYQGVLYQIHGDNGSGKSLLLDILSHTVKPKDGIIFYLSKSSEKNEYSTVNVRNKTSYYKHTCSFWKTGTVMQYLQKVLVAGKKSPGVAYQEAMDLLELFMLKDLSDKKRSNLTPGLYQKVELLRVLLENRDLILLDEPFAGVDDEFAKHYSNYLKKIVKNDKKTVVIASASSLTRFRMVDVLLQLHNGHIRKVEKPQQQQQQIRRRPTSGPNRRPDRSK